MTSKAQVVKDWLVNAGAALIVIVALVGVAYGVSEAHTNKQLTQQSIVVSNRHHAQNAQQNSEILSLTKANTALLKQHSADIANESQLLTNIQKADGELSEFAAWIVSVNQAICGGLHISCPAVPDFAPLPSS